MDSNSCLGEFVHYPPGSSEKSTGISSSTLENNGSFHQVIYSYDHC